jgi:hypothetical protein
VTSRGLGVLLLVLHARVCEEPLPHPETHDRSIVISRVALESTIFDGSHRRLDGRYCVRGRYTRTSGWVV